MLQTVLGLDAARIAQAFLVPPATMGQRLVRAKRKIREAGIPFAIPPPHELPARLDAVLEAIYAAYGLGRDEAAGVDPHGEDLADEAIWLARVDPRALPDEPEVRGLLALMLFCDARRAARRAPTVAIVPLSEQDPAAWSTSTRSARPRPSSARRRDGDDPVDSSSKPPSSRSTPNARRPAAPTGRRSSSSTSTSSAWRRRSGRGSRRPPRSRRRTVPRAVWPCSTRSTAPPWPPTSRTGPCARTSCASLGRGRRRGGGLRPRDRARGGPGDPAVPARPARLIAALCCRNASLSNAIRVRAGTARPPARGGQTMCPACVTTTVAAIAAGATSTGGIAALIVSRLRARNGGVRRKTWSIRRREPWRTGKSFAV